MGSSRKSQSQLRSRTTRSKGKLLADPAQNTQLLTDQLRALGLYAAPTLGDGNCLFRALSDQLYGTPSYHLQLRKDICDWIDAHKQRYDPFVEDERGLDVHLRCMREPATYGGHLELSAFAHLTRRNVKVVQPGLVYVIEWATGADLSPNRTSNPDLPYPDDHPLDDREKRRLRREQKRAEQNKPVEPTTTSPESTIYVAYHDWEHFSSIRNLKGPHAGLPHVVEIPADAELPSPVSKKKPLLKVRSKMDTQSFLKRPPKNKLPSPAALPVPPSLISPPASPASSLSPVPSFDNNADVPPLQPYLHVPTSPPTSSASSLPVISLRIRRSPKRAFDESSGSSSESVAKRTRSTASARRSLPSKSADNVSIDHMNVDGGPERDRERRDLDDSTPGLSAPGSSAGSTSSSELSSPPISTPPARSSPTPPPPPPPQPSPPPSSMTPTPPPERITRRQRKALARAALLSGATRDTGSGKIVIPGGRFKSAVVGRAHVRDGDEDDDDEEDPEWKRNGTGRVDVRGFRELKI